MIPECRRKLVYGIQQFNIFNSFFAGGTSYIFCCAEDFKECHSFCGKSDFLCVGRAGLRCAYDFFNRGRLYARYLGGIQFKKGEPGKSQIFCD